MEARHPHIFSDGSGGPSSWEALKAAERKEAGATSTMDGVARALPTSLDGHSAYLRDPVLLDALAALVLDGEALDGAGARR